MNNDRFRLLKDFGPYKKGKVFKAYGGLVSGVTLVSARPKNKIRRILFTNKEYFHRVGSKRKSTKIERVEWPIEGYRGKKHEKAKKKTNN